MSFGQTTYADPPLPKASYIIIILYYPRSEVCGLQSQGFHIHTWLATVGFFRLGDICANRSRNMIFGYMIALFIYVDRTVSRWQ